MYHELGEDRGFIIVPERKRPERHRRRLLCVDDERTIALLTAQVLETGGYEVTALCNPLQAIEICDRENVELAVLDYEMPQMTGACLAAQLRSARSKLKIVLFTGALQLPKPDLSLVDAVVHKSEGVEVLLATVDKLLAPF